MKRLLIAVLCLAVPGLFLLNAWEGFRYHSLADKVAALEQQQKALLDANVDAIAGIAYESSPERVTEKASEGLGLQRPADSAVTRLTVEPNAAWGPGQ